jgi:CubicO group peptidase (beta-lactamase class C family)
MKRRTFLQCGLAATMASPLWAALNHQRLDDAIGVLSKAIGNGQITSAVLHVTQRKTAVTHCFGQATENSMFLLGSISKPICVTALMTLFDQNKFQLDDPLKKFIPQFTEDGRDKVTIQHLLTHTSGLPDQLPDNNSLRKKHAQLLEFVEHTIRTPLEFAPGSKYQYSSMGIMLAVEVARLISGVDILELVDRSVFRPSGMKHSSLGLGRFTIDDMVPVQTEFAAPEAGGGDPAAKDWDWNSLYWRKLGAPWGGAHASAPDVSKFLAELLEERGNVVKPQTARLMARNHNRQGLTPRGLGLDTRMSAGPKGSETTFGHSGSTGTLAWADPRTETICVILTSLPARAVNPHPRDLACAHVAAAVS